MMPAGGEWKAAVRRMWSRTSLRKAIGAFAILAFMALYIAVAALIGTRLSTEHWLIQVTFFPIAGLGWIFPLFPLMRWIHAKDAPTQSPDI
jgi:hypothetical protein